jgi:glycosyltransferase involved in cell wall biosynthesis
MSKRKRLLMFGFQFPPGRGSGVYRVRAWANHFARRGWDVRLITVDSSYFAEVTGNPDWALLDTVDPRVRIHRFRFPRESLQHELARMSWLHANLSPAYIRVARAIPNRVFPEGVFGAVYPLMSARALRECVAWRPDAVLATGNPYAQLAAARLTARTLGVPYVVDFHDAWTLDQFGEKDAFPPDHPAWGWERRIVDDARLTVTVNRPLAEWYEGRYPHAADRVRIVENGYAEDVVGDPGPVTHQRGEPLRFGYVGTIRGDLPLAAFLDGWRLARKSRELRGATCDFYGYLGFFAWNQNGIRHRVEANDDGVRYRGPVPQTQLTQAYAGLDALCMLTPSSRYVTAGKVFDYMASGRPVVGVHDVRNDSTAAFADYPLFFPSGDISPESVARALVGAARSVPTIDAEVHRRCREEALRHTWDRVIAPVADEMAGWA